MSLIFRFVARTEILYQSYISLSTIIDSSQLLHPSNKYYINYTCVSPSLNIKSTYSIRYQLCGGPMRSGSLVKCVIIGNTGYFTAYICGSNSFESISFLISFSRSSNGETTRSCVRYQNWQFSRIGYCCFRIETCWKHCKSLFAAWFTIKIIKNQTALNTPVKKAAVSSSSFHSCLLRQNFFLLSSTLKCTEHQPIYKVD